MRALHVRQGSLHPSFASRTTFIGQLRPLGLAELTESHWRRSALNSPVHRGVALTVLWLVVTAPSSCLSAAESLKWALPGGRYSASRPGAQRQQRPKDPLGSRCDDIALSSLDADTRP